VFLLQDMVMLDDLKNIMTNTQNIKKYHDKYVKYKKYHNIYAKYENIMTNMQHIEIS